jgi:hypothetical protein
MSDVRLGYIDYPETTGSVNFSSYEGLLNCYNLTECVSPYLLLCYDIDTGDECDNCKGYPNGTEGCYGVDVYTDYFGGNTTESPCECVVYDNVDGVSIHYNDGLTDPIDCYREWNASDIYEFINKTVPVARPEAVDCSGLTDLYKQLLCYTSDDSSFIVNNASVVTDLTKEIFHIVTPPTVSLNRENGRFTVAILPEDQSLFTSVQLTIVGFNETVMREIISVPILTLEIPDDYFWSNFTMEWNISTVRNWAGGVVLLGEGEFQWYPYRKAPSEYCGDGDITHCLTKEETLKRVLIVMATGIAIYSGIFILGCGVKRVTVRRGWCKFHIPLMLILTASGVNGELTCGSASSIVTSELLQVVNGIETHDITTGMIDLKGLYSEACITAKNGDGGEVLKVKMKFSRLYYKLPPIEKYVTYSFGTPIVEKKRFCYENHGNCGHTGGARTFFCSSKYHGIVGCKELVDELNIRYKSDTARRFVGCTDFTDGHGHSKNEENCDYMSEWERGCTIKGIDGVGYRRGTVAMCRAFMFPRKHTYRVYSFGTHELWGEVEIDIDYLNGTVVENVYNYKLESTGNTVLQEGGITLTNDGITSTYDFEESKWGNSILVGMNGDEMGKTYLLTTSDPYIREPNKPGNIQCTFATGYNCEMNTNVCEFKLLNTGVTEVKCDGDDSTGQKIVGDALRHWVDDTEQQLPRKVEKFTVDTLVNKDTLELEEVTVELPDAPTLKIGLQAEFEVGTFIDDVDPQCKRISNANGCYACETGFSFTIELFSTTNPGQVLLEMVPLGGAVQNASYGLYTSSVYITNDRQEFVIRGYTSSSSNNYRIIAKSHNTECSIDINWQASNEDRLAQFDTPFDGTTQSGGGAGGVLNDAFKGDLGGVEDVFVDTLDDTSQAVKTGIIIAVCILGLCCCTPVVKACKEGVPEDEEGDYQPVDQK